MKRAFFFTPLTTDMTIELITIFIYLTIVFTLAYFSRTRRQDNKSKSSAIQDQYLAGRSINSFESLFSIIATEVSALTFIGIPAFAFGMDFRFIYLYFGAIVGRTILAIFYLPKFYHGQTTIYEKITTNYPSRVFISLVYTVTKFLSIGVRLYSGSILLSQYFQVDIYFAILALSALTMIYTMIGGLKAVVRTDVIQTLIFISGGIAAHLIIPEISGKQWGDMLYEGWQNNKIFTPSISYTKIIAIGFFGGIVFDMATHGVDQDFVQRLLATKTLRQAQKSIILSSFLSIFVGLLFLSIGTLLWSYHQTVPLGDGVKTDYVFAVFITSNFPPFLKGLMLSGVLAATMSTLDSTINALSSCMSTDFFPNRSAKNIQAWMRFDAIIITIILVGISFVASQSQEILTLGLKIASWSGGFLLFCLTFSVFKIKRLTLTEYVFAYVVNLLVIYIFHIKYNWPWQWNTFISLFFCSSIFSLKRLKKV